MYNSYHSNGVIILDAYYKRSKSLKVNFIFYDVVVYENNAAQNKNCVAFTVIYPLPV